MKLFAELNTVCRVITVILHTTTELIDSAAHSRTSQAAR